MKDYKPSRVKKLPVKTKNSVVLYHFKSTINTEVYTTTRKDAPLTSVYIKKSGLPETAPEAITISIEY